MADTPLALQAPDGELRPAFGRPLAHWDDGSCRWHLVSFGARIAGPHTLVVDPRDIPADTPTVQLHRHETIWTLSNDRLRLTLCETGPGIFVDLTCDGHSYLLSPADLAFCVDAASTRNEHRRSIRVMSASPQSVRLKVEGAHFRPDGSRCLEYRLGIELWAGWPAVRLDYHYFNREPGQADQKINRIAMESAWNFKNCPTRHFLQSNHGLFYVSRHVFNPAPVSLVADFDRQSAHVDDPAMLMDDVDYPFYLHAPLMDTHTWLGVGDDEQAVYLQMHDFLQARPNRLASAGNRLAAEFWPATAEPLDLPQGRSRQQTITLAFVRPEPRKTGSEKISAAPRQAPKGIAATLEAPIHEGRATLDPAWIALCNEFKQSHNLPAGQHVRIENNLRDLVRLDMPVTKFDVGDTDSHYNSSYGTINKELAPPLTSAPAIPRIFPRGYPTQTYLDCHEPVWTNNEYDVIHAFCGEIMRTARHDLWSTLRLSARHNIEVDFIHYSDHRWLHRATPAHSARHTTTGAYPSHFWTQGLLEYYCLTGDHDALEVALALGDKTLENFNDPGLRPILWGFNREIGWSVLALACLVDITGEQRFLPLLTEMVDYLIAFDRTGFKGGINLSAGNDRQNLNRQVVANFFGYSSMLEGVDLFADMTGRKDVAEWLIRFCHDLATEAMNAAREGQMCGINFSITLAIGFERTEDQRFLDLAGLVLDAAYWMGPGLQGGHSVKPVASIYRCLPRLLGHAWRHGLLDAYEYPALRKAKVRDRT